MKGIIVLILLTAMSVYTYGQKAVILSTPVTDTVRAKVNKSNKVKNVDGVMMYANKDIVQNLTGANNFTTVRRAITAAGLIGTLKSKGPITFFAPTNDAFKNMPEARLDTLMKKSHMLELSSLLTLHAIPGRATLKVLSKKIKSGKGKATLITLSGYKIYATQNGESIVLTDELGNKSTIEPEKNNIEQSNGLIHVINNVLVPKAKAI